MLFRLGVSENITQNIQGLKETYVFNIEMAQSMLEKNPIQALQIIHINYFGFPLPVPVNRGSLLLFGIFIQFIWSLSLCLLHNMILNISLDRFLNITVIGTSVLTKPILS